MAASDFWTAFQITQGLRQRAQEQAQNEQLGNALRDILNKSYQDRNQEALQPYQANVKNIADSSLATAIDAALGGGTDAEKQAAMETGKKNVALATTAQNTLNDASRAYQNPIASLQGVNGTQFLRLFPTISQLDQSRINQFDVQQRLQKMNDWIASLAPEQQNIAKAAQMGLNGTALDRIYPAPAKPVEVSPGGTLINPTTGQTIFTAPNKPDKVTASSTVKLKNGNVGILMNNGTILDSGKPFAETATGGTSNAATRNAVTAAKTEISNYNEWRKNPMNITKQDSEYPRYNELQGAWGVIQQVGGGQTPSAPTAPSGNNGMSPVMQDFADALNKTIQSNGKDFARQWVKANGDALRSQGIDPDVALTWIPE